MAHDSGELYEQYVNFMEDMAKVRGESVPLKSRDEFPSWLGGQADHVRDNLIKDYRRGYAGAIEDAHKEIADYLASQRE